MRIRVYPEPILLQPAILVKSVTKELREVVRKMIDVMYSHKGVGLAAQQVGLDKLITVFNPDPEREKERVLLNPKICLSKGNVEVEEGCLSFPGIYGRVRRASHVLVTGMNLSGKEVRIEAEGLLAQILQHEVDHLNGILFTAKMTPATKIQVQRQLKQLEERYRKAQGD